MTDMRTAKTVSITLPPDLLAKAQELAQREHDPGHRQLEQLLTRKGDPRHAKMGMAAPANSDDGSGMPKRVMVVDDNDRERLWTLGDNVFPSFATYRERAASAART